MITKILSSSLLRSSGIYTIINFTNVAIPFLLMPIMTRYMSPADYGVIAMFQVLVGLVYPITNLGMIDAINRKYFARDKINLPVYIGTCLITFAVSCGLAACVMFALATPISIYSSFPKGWLWSVIFFSIGQYLVNLTLTLWQIQFKATIYAIYQILQTLLNMGLSLWLIVELDMRWQGRLEAQLIVAFLFGIIGIVSLRKQKLLQLSFDWNYMKDAMKYGIPLVPHAFGGFIMTMTDRILITRMIGVAETGLYSVGSQFGMVIALVEGAIGTAWSPWLFERLSRNPTENDKKKLVKITYIYFGGLTVLTIGWSCISFWMLGLFVGPNFLGASKFVSWIALGNAFEGMYRIVSLYIFFAQKTHILTWITMVSGGLYIILNYALISINGAVGVAQSFMIIKLLFFLSAWVLSYRVYRMPWLGSKSE